MENSSYFKDTLYIEQITVCCWFRSIIKLSNICIIIEFILKYNKRVFFFFFIAVQNERQPRNTATIRPEALVEMDQERALREAAVAVGVFG